MKFYPPGTRIAGRYEVASRPLMGGMGIVYLCFDHHEERPVAVKTFKPESLPNRAARDRFLREGTTWVNLGRHPHIVRAYGVERIGDGREVYLVLELVAKEEGRADASLRSWLVPGRPLPVEQALLFALQIARGMAHATATVPGFVHRDLKPENVLVGADKLPSMDINRVRVTDFGLVRALGAGETLAAVGEDEPLAKRPGLTRMGAVLGTPTYMAPEQWERTDVSQQADIYALGCILGEMLTGRRLVRERTLQAFKRAHQAGHAREVVANLPKSLAELLARCLVVHPSERYECWSEVEAALGVVYKQVTRRAVPEREPVEEVRLAEHVDAGWSYSEIGVSYLDLGKAEVALSYFQRAQEIGSAEGEPRLQAAGFNHLGVASKKLGDPQKAVECYEQALSIYDEISDRHGEGTTLGNLGSVYADLGDVERAIGYFEQALAISKEFADRRSEGSDLSNLGNAYARLGDPRRAIEYYEPALSILREVGDRHGEGAVLSNLGLAYADLGDAQRAIECHEHGLVIAREIGDRQGEGNALGNLGSAYFILGKTLQAVDFFKQRLAIACEVGDRQGEANALSNLADAYVALGDTQHVIGYYKQALAIDREIGNRRGEGFTLSNLGSAYASQGDARQAVELWQQAIAIMEEVGDVKGVASTSFNLALLLVRTESRAEALPHAERAAQIFAQIGHEQYAQQAQQLATLIRATLVFPSAKKGD